MATFGTTTTGGSVANCNADRMLVGKYNLPVAGTVTAINVIYGTDSGAANSKAVLYADSAGSPGALLAVSASVAIASGDLTHAVSVALAAGDYWIGSITDSFRYGWTFAAGSGSYAYSDPNSYASPTNPFGTPSASGVSLISVYATYTTSTPAATPGPLLFNSNLTFAESVTVQF